MKILIETVPHKEQAYPTVGDWRRHPDGTLHIKVSEEIGDKYALLVALHELVEVTLCEDRGIQCSVVDTFDKNFEARREDGNEDEPGDDPACPYKNEHFFATNLERAMAHEMQVDWKAYEESIYALP